MAQGVLWAWAAFLRDIFRTTQLRRMQKLTQSRIGSGSLKLCRSTTLVAFMELTAYVARLLQIFLHTRQFTFCCLPREFHRYASF